MNDSRHGTSRDGLRQPGAIETLIGRGPSPRGRMLLGQKISGRAGKRRALPVGSGQHSPCRQLKWTETATGAA